MQQQPAQPRPHAGGGDAGPQVAHALRRNAATTAAGQELAARLPWHVKLWARTRSAALLAAIMAMFWPTVWAVLGLCALHWAWGRCVAAARGWQEQQMQKRELARHARRQQQTTTTTTNTVPAPGRSGALALNPLARTSMPPYGQHINGHGRAPAAAAPQPHTPVRTAVVTGGKMTKALHVCRHLHAAGWRVVLLETHKYWHVGARLSASVAAFHTVPVPEQDAARYVRAIADIVEREGASLFVPVSAPIASLYDALGAQALPSACRSWCLGPELTALFDDKAAFSEYAASLGLRVPRHHAVTSKAQLRALNSRQALGNSSFILKNLSYDSVHRSDLFQLPCPPQQLEAYLARPELDVSPEQPWILQQFIQGREYSCYTLAHEGRVVAHADTAAALSNLNYAYAAHPGVRQWVDAFVTRSGVSGQLCFDFIDSAADGVLQCIECNPRTSSVITEFHDNPQLAAALAAPSSIKRPVLPLPASRPTYWWYNEVARLLLNPAYLWQFLLVVSHGVDAVFDVSDPLPFLGLHFLQIPVLLLGNMWRGNPWTKVDLCIGKLAELHGD